MHERDEEADRTSPEGSGIAPGSLGDKRLASRRFDQRHRVDKFSCPRSARVQDFLANKARKFEEQLYSKVFILENPNDDTEVWGYYTLTASSLPKDHLSKQQQKLVQPGLPVPFILVGYMGRDEKSPKGTGAALIVDAARRAYLNSDVGAWGLILQAEGNNRQLVGWYTGMGFKEVPGADNKPNGVMFAPYKWIDANLKP